MNNQLLAYGAPLTSAFRSLGVSALPRNLALARPKVPKPLGLSDLAKTLYDDKDLAALARYFGGY